MNIGTYINCHNGTSTFTFSSSLSPFLRGHTALRSPSEALKCSSFETLRLIWLLYTYEAEDGREKVGWGGFDTCTVHGKVMITKQGNRANILALTSVWP